MAVLVVVLGWSVTSCKDDDKDNETKSPEQTAQEVKEAASKFWDVVGQLTSMDNYTEDYKDKTFEPTIGDPQEGNSTVRIVATNDMASAAERFASLVGLEVGEGFSIDTQDFVWKDDAVGTLTYHQTNNGQSWAEVEVNIRQLPSLQKIIYSSAEQAGTNGSFSGSAYYRFGDVISRENEDGQTEYWVCVRPAFGKEGKGDSHWVTLSPLPTKNIERITKWNREFYVPKGLGKNEEQMQNFIEMLYAMWNPKDWYDTVLGNNAPSLMRKGLRTFHDFSHDEAKLKYHNQFFWQRVRAAWDQMGLYQKILGFESSNPTITDMFGKRYGGGRIHLLYSGYSWWSNISGNLSLFEMTYETGENIDELNQHLVVKTEVKHDMRDVDFDIRNDYTLAAPYLEKPSFFGDQEPRYIIRHATGASLMPKGSKWDYKQPISDVTPVYVYNRFYYPKGTDGAAPDTDFRDLTITEPEVTIDDNNKSKWNRNAYNGDSFYLTGDVCIDEQGSRWFCLLNAGGNAMNDTESLLNAPYSYFVTFDNIIDGNGNVDKDIVQETTLPKLMVPLHHFFANYKNQPLSPLYSVFAQNIKENTGVDILKMAIQVDTLITIQGTEKTDLRPCYCTAVAYRKDNSNDWSLMRIITDGAYDKTGNRQWHNFFYTKYENTDVPILLKDIANQEKVDRYAPDRWAVLPLNKTEQRRDYRRAADERATNIRNYLWIDGQQATDATSMWNEPILVFRVTQVYDRGGNHATMTYRGTKFVKCIPSKIRESYTLEGFPKTWWQINSIGVFKDNRMTKDGEAYQWPDWNNDIIR